MNGHNRKIYMYVVVSLIMCAVNGTATQAKDTFPSKAINIIVPFVPGGAMDIAARTIAPFISKYLNTSVIINNLPGAGGAIGFTKAYKTNPDGYTLLIWNTLTPLTEEYRREVGYKTLNYTFLCAFSVDNPILVVHPEGNKNFGDFVKQAKAQSINIGTTGQYTVAGFEGILMAAELGMKINWVAYGGGAESLIALAGKHIDAVMTLTSSVTALTKAGKIIPILIFANKRSIKYPNIPTPGELGFNNMPILYGLTGIVGPPGMDKGKAKILEEALLKAVKDPDYIALTEKVNSAAEPVVLSAAAYRQQTTQLAHVAEKYKTIIK